MNKYALFEFMFSKVISRYLSILCSAGPTSQKEKEKKKREKENWVDHPIMLLFI